MKTKFRLIQVNTKSVGGYNKITNLAHNFGEGEAKGIRNSVKLIQKHSFCQFCCQFLNKGPSWSSEKCKGGVLMFQG